MRTSARCGRPVIPPLCGGMVVKCTEERLVSGPLGTKPACKMSSKYLCRVPCATYRGMFA
eukprot:9669644-Lingulodinium_polyedra.AAC.1